MKIRLFFVLIILFPFVSCEEADNAEINLEAEIVSISYGTSFGECVGYCKQGIEIEGTVVKFLATSWVDTDNYPDIEITGNITQEEWDDLIDEIDYIVFRNLEEVIGCPDCADGGAEWIEIETNEQSHKITFEYNNPPEEVTEYIDELSNLFIEFHNKAF